jgi:hypothetical protein
MERNFESWIFIKNPTGFSLEAVLKYNCHLFWKFGQKMVDSGTASTMNIYEPMGFQAWTTGMGRSKKFLETLIFLNHAWSYSIF